MNIFIVDDPPQYTSELFKNLPHKKSKEERFREFIANNPILVQSIKEKAFADKATGRRGSIKRYFEELRGSAIFSSSKYKLNNDFTSLMARYLMDTTPELAGFFELRAMCDNPMRKVPRK